jgi:Ribbon-helix-helix protein, copG family
MSTTTRITVSVPTDLAVRLDAEARATDRTVSAIVRRGLRAVLSPEFESPPLGELGHAFLPGTPATAVAPCHRSDSTAAASGSPYRGGGSFQHEELMATDPYKQKDDLVERQRRFQESHGAAQVTNQHRRDAEAGCTSGGRHR